MTAHGRRHILAIDVGGSHVKLRVSNRRAVRVFASSRSLTAAQMVDKARTLVHDWSYHRVTLGFPGMVVDGRIVCEPANLGLGWLGFDFTKAFHRPVRILNDAVMQALGHYSGGRMLFLGFGTALGAVLISDSKIHPMEIAHLPFTKRGLIQNYVGDDARRRLGRKRWSANAKQLIKQLGQALDVPDIVAGGGNAIRLAGLPHNVRVGDANLAFVGGFRAWRGALRGD